jgi:ribosomal-protein-alanine N-acetyltransferase
VISECTEASAAAAVQPELRPLAAPHLQACLALDRRCLGGLWSADQWEQELADERRPGLGLWHGEALCAMACGWLVVDELHITLVAVDQPWQRRGLGRRLLAALLARAAELGAAHATLEVATANQAALALYRSLGFSDAGIRRAYYRDGGDALIQWLRLPESDPRDQGCG